MQPIARSSLAFLFVLLVNGLALGQPAGPPPDLDEWVARAMATFEVPGLAVGIVKDGKVVVAKGYGVRTLGEPARVDEHTLFGIASNTKAFTATALGMLVDEQKVAWDDPVTRHLPAFALYDPWVTRELILRDTLSHRSGLGLGAGDLLFWPDTDRTREDVLRQSRFIKPATSLRTRYAYNNLMFVVAGEVVRAASGTRYDEFVRARIFEPLGMSETRFGNEGLAPGANLASPHSKGWRVDGPLTPVPYTQDRTWAAAAGIRSSIVDLSKWVLAQLSKGKGPGDARVWSEAVSHELWAVHTPQRAAEPPPPMRASRANFAGYGLGFGLRDFAGRKVVSHGGALIGMVTTIAMVPDEGLGVIVLTNQEEGGAYTSIVYHVFDHYFGRPATDWIGALRAQRTETLRKAWDAEKRAAAERDADSRPSLPLEAYAREYDDAWYGRVSIAREGNRLVLRMTHSPALVAELTHWQHDTFRAVFREKTTPDAYVTFSLDHTGHIVRASMVPCSSLADFSFDYQDLDLRPAPKPSAAESRP